MNIGGNRTLDLQGSDLVKFVQSAAVGDQLDLQKGPVQNGFHASVLPNSQRGFEFGKIPSPPGGLLVPWTLIQQWDINQVAKNGGPQRIQQFTIETTAWREIEATVCIALLLKDGLDANTEALISNAFAAYQYPASGDLDAYAEAFLAAAPGVSPYSFGLTFFYRVKVLSDQSVDETLLNRARQAMTGKEEQYRLRLVGPETALLVLRPNPPHPNSREEPDSGTAVQKVADGDPPAPGCDNLVTEFTEVGRQRSPIDEYKLEWAWGRWDVGSCSFDMYHPVKFERRQDLVALVSYRYPKPLDQYVKTQVQDCARQAATSAVVSFIVFTDLRTAADTFAGLFWKCLGDKLGQTLACLSVNLLVNTEGVGDWRQS